MWDITLNKGDFTFYEMKGVHKVSDINGIDRNFFTEFRDFWDLLGFWGFVGIFTMSSVRCDVRDYRDFRDVLRF